MTIQVRIPNTRRVPDPIGMGTGTIFYSRVAPVPDPNRDGYGTSIFSHPRVTRRLPTAIILGYEQVKICLFCYVKYDLF
jgi:hypothetical protein